MPFRNRWSSSTNSRAAGRDHARGGRALVPQQITCRMHDGLYRALGPKIQYPPELYLRLNNSLYAWYGPPLGVAIQIGALAATGALAWLVRRQRLAQLFTRLRSSCRRQRWATISRRGSRSTCASAGWHPPRCPATSWRYGLDGNTATHWTWGCSPPPSSCWGARCSCVKPPERRRRAAIHHQKGLSNGDFQDRLSLPTAPKE